MNVTIEIDELVLHGFPAADRHAIADALETELARLVAERGLPAGLADGAGAALAPSGRFTLAPGAAGASVGAGAVEAIYQALRQGLAHPSRPTDAAERPVP